MEQQDHDITTRERIELDDLFTVQALADRYPDILSLHTLRWQLRDREKNGLAAACLRVGKNILISKSRYEGWLASRAGHCTN